MRLHLTKRDARTRLAKFKRGMKLSIWIRANRWAMSRLETDRGRVISAILLSIFLYFGDKYTGSFESHAECWVFAIGVEAVLNYMVSGEKRPLFKKTPSQIHRKSPAKVFTRGRQLRRPFLSGQFLVILCKIISTDGWSHYRRDSGSGLRCAGPRRHPSVATPTRPVFRVTTIAVAATRRARLPRRRADVSVSTLIHYRGSCYRQAGDGDIRR
jgi:hypothetical protein